MPWLKAKKSRMSHLTDQGFFNPAYHDSETLEINRSTSRKSPHSNPYARDDESRPRGRADWQQSEGQYSYDNALERVPWKGWQEGSWRGRDSIPMGLLSPPPESPKWRHDLNHSTFQVDSAPPCDVSPMRPASAISGNMTMRWRGMTMRRLSMFPSGEAINPAISEDAIRSEMENEEQDLVKELVALSTRERIRSIRALPMSFEEKKHIRSQVLAFKSVKRSRQLTCCADCSECISLSFRRCGANMTLTRQTLELWRATLKEIGGKFGTGVLSYFLFLKWLLMFNVFSFLVNFGFITIPQLIYQPYPLTPTKFRGLELLTGEGYFTNTVMYYGGYSNATISNGTMATESKYNLQLAYFFTIAAYMVLCGVSLIYSMASSFKKHYVQADTTVVGAWQQLCSWDFNVTNERAVRQRKNNLRVQLKESLSESSQKSRLSEIEKLQHFAVHLSTWLFSTGLAVGCGAGIYFLCIYDQQRAGQPKDSGSLVDEAATLLLPFMVSLVNLVIPLFYSLLNKIEQYSNPRTQIYVLIVRNVILKMSILGILCYYWMNNVAKTFPCWESVVGQSLYRLVVVDFLFLMLGSFFGEFLSNVMGTKCFPSLGVPEFDVARNVLDLIYAQTLAWIGIYFSPLLPVIQILKFFFLFYLKKVSLNQNCQPPRRVGRAAQMQTIYIALLFFPSFVGALSMVAYTVWSLTPSEQCGPFQGLNTTFGAVSVWMDELRTIPGSQWVIWIYQKVVRSEVFYFLITIIILVFMYIFWQITQGRKLLIIILRQQIANEGKDKAFLLERLQNLQKFKPAKIKNQNVIKKRQDGNSQRRQSTSNAMIQALLARQQLEEEESGRYGGVPLSSDISTTSSAMVQAMLAQQRAEEMDGRGLHRMPIPLESSSAALIQAMQARDRAESEKGDEGQYGSTETPLGRSTSSAVIQVMQARQRAVEEDNEYERTDSSTSSAQVRVHSQREDFYKMPDPSQGMAPEGSSALIQAMLARQQAQNEYDDGY